MTEKKLTEEIGVPRKDGDDNLPNIAPDKPVPEEDLLDDVIRPEIEDRDTGLQEDQKTSPEEGNTQIS